MKPGDIAGSEDESGYIRIDIDGITYRAHQLAWFWVNNEWALVDHRDQIKGNNAIDNLRKTTANKNPQNQGVRYTNLLGVKGVQERHGKYRAYITFNYKTYHLGTHDTIEEAIAARRAGEEQFFSNER